MAHAGRDQEFPAGAHDSSFSGYVLLDDTRGGAKVNTNLDIKEIKESIPRNVSYVGP